MANLLIARICSAREGENTKAVDPGRNSKAREGWVLLNSAHIPNWAREGLRGEAGYEGARSRGGGGACYSL
jgi:hypothetical protein